MNLRPAICFKWHIPACLLFFLSFFIIQKNNAQPAGFTDQLFLSGWNEVAGFTWDANGRMYVWERDGRVWIVENGARLPNPLLDISDEVGGWRDFGLLGFALDPNFLSNGYFYLLYVVDRHHLFNAGTSQYDPNTNEYFAATIGRITRYQADGTTNYSTIVPGSRLVLVGANEQDGPPILHESHGTGSLVFGDDGTLLATLGDGASYSSFDQGSASETYWQQGLDDGIITPAQNIGAYRCQTLDNYSGKILRIDPATGQGLPSNPFWDAANPQSPASRTWARGVRNPYRMCLVPESGSHVPSDGNPGTFIFGDVGWGTREELNVVNAPGLNFGWPKFEGMTHQPGYNNPDYTPAQHELPKVDWRTGTPRGLVNGSIVNVGSAALPGPVFNGNASTGGVWYGHGDFPEEWHDTYFHADYGAGWIRNFRFDNNWNPVEVKNFINTAGACVFLNTDPAQTALYYVRWPDQIRKVSFTGTTLHTPVAFASANVISGTSPLTVSFSSFNTFDQDGDPLTYLWDFGDGTTSTLPHPVHTFSGGPGPTGFTVSLTVSDPGGLSDEATLPISLNNLPPAILSTSVDAIHTFDPNTTTVVSLSANVSDGDHPASQLSYFWDVKLFHNNHSHPLQSFTTPTASVNLTAVNCYSASYWYQVNLTVSDPAGATSFYQKNIYPACAGTAQNISFTPIPDKVAGDVPFAISASATSGLPVTFYVVEGPAGVLGNIVTLQGVPGKVTIVATQPGDGVYAPATNVEQSFWVNANSTGSQNQAITFPAIPDKLTTDAPFTISASATSGLPVSFQVVSGPATISGNTVTLTGQPGAVTIRATQTGNTQWSAALPVERTFQVSLPSGGGNVDLELTVESDHSVLTLFNTISFTFTLTNTGTATADNVRVFLPIPSTVVWVGGNEYSLSQGTYDHLGSKVWFLGDLPAAANATITVNWYVLASDPLTAWAEVSATDQTDADSTPGNGTCCTANEDDEASMTLTMPGQGPQNQTISFAPISDKETTDAPFIIAASATSGLPVSFQIVSGPATIAGNIVTLNGTTGTVTVRATQSGNANWNPAPPVEQSFLVNEPGLLNQTITFAPLPNKQTTDAPFTISAIATSGLPVGFSIVGGPATIAGNTVTLDGVPGTVTVRASQPGNAQYNPAPDVDRSFQVNTPGGGSGVDLELTIGASPATITQWGNIAFTATLTNVGTVEANNVKVDFPKPAGVVFVGGNEATVSKGNYGLFTDQIWNVGDMPAGAVETITVNWFILQNTPLTGWAQVSSASPADDDSTPGNGTCCVAIEDDEAAFTATLPGAGPQDQTITFPPIPDKESDDPPFSVSASATSGLPVEFEIVSGPATIAGNTITLNGTTGQVIVRATQPGNANWNPAAPVERTFQINMPGLDNQTITFPSIPNKLTTDVPFTISATATSGLPVSFDIVSGPATITGNTITLDGTTGQVTVRASQPGNAQYNPAPDVLRTFAVIEPGQGGGPDLEIAMTASSPVLLIWQDITFSITLTNAGDETANGIRLSVPIPQGLAYTASNASQGNYDLFFNEWVVGSLAQGETATLDIVLFCLQNTTPLPYFVQVIAATPADLDSTPDNNTSGTPAEDDEALITLAPSPNPLSGVPGGMFALNAWAEGATTRLKWISTIGENALEYIVERSANGYTWYEVLVQPNREFENRREIYDGTDPRPVPGWNFYRIKQLRTDGSCLYSNVVMLEHWDDLYHFKLFPNPANQYTDINLTGVEGRRVRLLLIDRMGRLIKETEIEPASSAPHRLQLDEVPEGWYVLWIQAEGSKAKALPLIVGNK